MREEPPPRQPEKVKGGLAPVGHDSYKCGYSGSLDPRNRQHVGPTIDLTDSQLERHELFLLEDGEKKVEEQPETRTLARPSLQLPNLLTE